MCIEKGSGESRFFDAKKGGHRMGCNHERLRTVGDRLFCKICGEELPLEYLTGDQKQAKNPPAAEKTDKPAPKKRTPKNSK